MFGEKALAPWFSFLLCIGCAGTTNVHTIPFAFDVSEAEKLLLDGPNRVEGRAQINFIDGGMATCAGGQAVLIPATQYAKERMRAVFDENEVLFYPRIGAAEHIQFEPDDPSYSQHVKVATCDKEGNFEFTALADGEFFIGTTVNWWGGIPSPGFNTATFMRQVRLEKGVNVEVDFSHQMYRKMSEPRPIERF